MKHIFLLFFLLPSASFADLSIEGITIDSDGSVSIVDEDGDIFVGDGNIMIDDEDGDIFVDGENIIIDDEDGGIFVGEGSIVIDNRDGDIIVDEGLLKTGDIIVKEFMSSGSSYININFESGRAELNDRAALQVRELHTAINDMDEDFVLIGHTDDVGSAADNIDLSYERAESVRKYLKAHGYTHRVQIDGKGESDPIASNNTESGRFTNRRVEIRKLSN